MLHLMHTVQVLKDSKQQQLSQTIESKCKKHFTILSFNNSWLHLVQVLFDSQLFVFDHLLLFVHSFLDLLAHHLES